MAGDYPTWPILLTKPKRMITSRIKKLDNTSIELKAKYRPKYNKRSNIQKYSVETYIFLPIELGINKRNFTKTDFYREYKNYLKIDPPKISLAEIADKSANFIQVYDSIFQNIDLSKEASINRIDDNTKILMNIYKKSLKREIRKVLQYPHPNEKIRVTLRLIKNLDIFIDDFRKKIESIKDITDNTYIVVKTLNVADEYISNLKYKYFHEILMHLMKFEDEVYYEATLRTKLSLESEIEYRRYHDFPLYSNQKKENAKLIIRWDNIKYFITNKLIIKAKIDNESKYIEEILYSIAAGIAMIFATGIAFYYNQKFGNFTLSFFVVLVLSYMFKDRIKEWFRSIFSSILKKQLLDHHFNLFDDNNQKIGVSKDGFEFSPQRNLKRKIHNIRYSESILGEELMSRNEKILKFTRKVNINMKRFIKTFKETDIRGINDIITFNFDPIIMRMQETKFPIYTMNNIDGVKRINSEKSYSINIIQEISMDKKKIYHHYKVFVSKSGIKKLKVVVW